MSYDLALGTNNDLVFAANRDLLPVSGRAIYDQRIRTRLKIRRGTWVYDAEKRIGSRIENVIGRASDNAQTEVVAYVHEALDDLDDIVVTTVQTEIPDAASRSSNLLVRVGYVIQDASSEAPFSAPDEQLEENIVTIQL